MKKVSIDTGVDCWHCLLLPSRHKVPHVCAHVHFNHNGEIGSITFKCEAHPETDFWEPHGTCVTDLVYQHEEELGAMDDGTKLTIPELVAFQKVA